MLFKLNNGSGFLRELGFNPPSGSEALPKVVRLRSPATGCHPAKMPANRRDFF
jgi:hypothetical protein